VSELGNGFNVEQRCAWAR